MNAYQPVPVGSYPPVPPGHFPSGYLGSHPLGTVGGLQFAPPVFNYGGNVSGYGQAHMLSNAKVNEFGILYSTIQLQEAREDRTKRAIEDWLRASYPMGNCYNF